MEEEPAEVKNCWQRLCRAQGKAGWVRRGTSMKAEAVGRPPVVTSRNSLNVHFGPGGSPVPSLLSTHESFLCSCTQQN